MFFLQKNSYNNNVYNGFFNSILSELTYNLNELKRIFYTMKIVYKKNKEIKFYISKKQI